MKSKLTSKELEALVGIYDSDYRDGYSPVDHPVWTWSANPFKSLKSFGGVMASLNAKGLAVSTEDGKDSTVYMTQAGWEAMKAALPERASEFAEVEA